MSYETVELIQRICEEVGGSFREDYSGRFMYGKTCVGIDTSDPEMVYQLAEDYGIPAPTRDNMGLDWILYWPGISFPKPEVPETNEDLDVTVTLEEKKEVHISEIIEKVSEEFKSQTVNITEKENLVLRGILKFFGESETRLPFKNSDILQFGGVLSLKQITGVLVSLKKKGLVDKDSKVFWFVTDNGAQVLETLK
jgi:hypothetical protein